jgi:hypothetical protein
MKKVRASPVATPPVLPLPVHLSSSFYAGHVRTRRVAMWTRSLGKKISKQ